MKIVFMGTPEFANPCLESLIQSNHEVLAVVTQPDKPKGRGKKILPTPIKELAMKYSIPVWQPEKIKEANFVEKLKSLEPDLIVVVAFGQILSKEILEIPQKGCINVHASLLPKYRGAGPIYWAVINGEKKTGVTTMYMDVGLDTGDMIIKEEIEILDHYTAKDVHDKLSVLGAQVLMKTIDLVEKGVAPRTKQEDDIATYAPMLYKNIGEINWNNDSKEIRNLIRGTNPWPIAYTYYKGQKVKIFTAELLDEQYPNKEKGEIISVLPKKGIVVATKDSSLLIVDAQFEGSKRMSMEEYLKGHTIEVGVILGEIKAK